MIADTTRTQLLEIPLDAISPSTLNPRREFTHEDLEDLAQSIKQHGLLQPIRVQPISPSADAATASGSEILYGPCLWELIAGERRWKAAGMAGLDTILAVVGDSLSSDAHVAAALAENVSRRDLSAVEVAEAYKSLVELGHTQESIAALVHRSRESVTNTLRLLELPASVRRRIRQGELSATHGLALLRLRDWPEQVARLATRAVDESWSTDRLRAEVDQCLAPNIANGTIPVPAHLASKVDAKLIADANEILGEAGALVRYETPEPAPKLDTINVSSTPPAASLNKTIELSSPPTAEAQAFEVGDLVQVRLRIGDLMTKRTYQVEKVEQHAWGHWLYAIQDPQKSWSFGTVRGSDLFPEPAYVPPQQTGPQLDEWWADMRYLGGYHSLDEAPAPDRGEMWRTACGRDLVPRNPGTGKQGRECVICKRRLDARATPEPEAERMARLRREAADYLESLDEAAATTGNNIPSDPPITEHQAAERLWTAGMAVWDADADEPLTEAGREARYQALATAWITFIDALEAFEPFVPEAYAAYQVARFSQEPKEEPTPAPDLRDEELGVDAKGRRWQVSGEQGATYCFWRLCWWNKKSKSWSLEQYGPTYESREAAIAAFREKWEAPA